MKNPILSFELRHWVKSPLAFFLVFIFFAFALVTMLGTGGYFDGPSNFIGSVNYLNSPYALAANSFFFTKLLLFLVVIFFGLSIYRDYQHNCHVILYSFPIRKSEYLFGKFFSACLLIFVTSFFVFIAFWLGETMLGLDNPKITDFQFQAYFTAVGFYLFSTLLIIGTFVFIAVAMTRNIYVGFIVIFCFVLLQMILESTLFNHSKLLAILDPFGQNAFRLITEDWDQSVRNSSRLPIGTMVLLNRLFWITLAGISFFLFAGKFDFQYDQMLSLRRGSSASGKSLDLPNTIAPDHVVEYKFNLLERFKKTIFLAKFDLKFILTNWMFIVLSIFGMASIFFFQLKLSNTGDFNLLPLTRLFLGAPLSIYALIVILSTFLFSGILVSRSSTHKMNLILDATPTLNGQLISSKILAIAGMHLVQLILFLSTGILIQLINGYYHFEFQLYFFQLFILTFPMLLVWNVTSIFFHSFFQNIFLGIFMLACLWLGSQSLEQVGIDTHLLKYNNLPFLKYSDLHGYGNQLEGYFMIAKYWVAVGILLLLVTHLMWRRGTSLGILERFNMARKRLNISIVLLILCAFANFGFKGFELYEAEQASKVTSLSQEQLNVAFEDHKLNWAKYDNIHQPKICAYDLSLDIYPSQRRFEASGECTLVNDGRFPMDTIFVRTGFDELTTIDWSGQAAQILHDKKMKTHLFKLAKVLNPGDSITFNFDIKSLENTLLETRSNVLKNGTFLKDDILPRIGYQFAEADTTNTSEHENHFYHKDAHGVKLKTIISTSKDQIAIAPGSLISSEEKKDRNYFSYETSMPVKLNFSFHSGQYEVLETSEAELKIEVYYNKQHIHNTENIIDGLKVALDYNSQFGKYPYKTIRVIEFPHTEESYAGTLTANNIPSSELLFIINAAAMEGKIDLPFYVMAHELTHEWFGNQLKPANAPGAKMLTESITEYITLSIYRKYLGEELADIFLETQYKRYKNGRRKEIERERALYQVEPHQEYISYGKGAIALNEIRKAIGEDEMNLFLKKFLENFGGNGQAYPTTDDFIRLLKSQVDGATHPLIDRWLVEIHDFKLEEILSN